MNVQKNSARGEKIFTINKKRRKRQENHPLGKEWHELLKRPFISQLTLPPINHRRRKQASAIPRRRPRSPDGIISRNEMEYLNGYVG